MQEVSLDNLDVNVTQPKEEVSFKPFGNPIIIEEVSKRVSDNLYQQLSDGDDQFVLDAVSRAQKYVGTLLARLDVGFSLDNPIQRELVLIWTLYELHRSLGHEEAGREYRIQFKDTVIAAYGSYPDSDNTTEAEAAPSACVVAPPRNPRSQRLHHARRLTV